MREEHSLEGVNMADHLGDQLGNYRLVRLLGQGDDAEVYLGEHLYAGISAAIKVPHVLQERSVFEHFRAEARILGHLNHPHIVRMLDFGIERNIPFLVLEYAPDGTLRQRHPKDTQLPIEVICSYVNQVADALQYLHDHKLLHRNVKPEHMLINREGLIVLSGFGMALPLQGSSSQGKQEMAGIIAYMAPEQIQGHLLPASDQYALGIVVYEWLCGEKPFYGPFAEIAAKHTFVPPPILSERIPMISLAVEHVVMKALEKDPQQRFPSVKDFAAALERAR